MTLTTTRDNSVLNAERWGLNTEAIEDLADRLHRIWERFHPLFRGKGGKDTSEYAFEYLRALLTMDCGRNYAEIARRVISIHDDGQNLQQFMSDAPWEAKAVFQQIQNEIKEYPQMHGGTLTVDESGDRRFGENSAGSSRQYLGNLGKVDRGQVGVMLGYYQAGTWTMVDGDLYIPSVWFDEEHAQLRKRWHIPEDRVFQRKPQIALDMVKEAKANNFPFSVVACDSIYGCDTEFRIGLNDENILYIADIHSTTPIYLNRPVVGIPQTPEGRRGRPYSKYQVLSDDQFVEPRSLIGDMHFEWVFARDTERGSLLIKCATRRVWTVADDGKILEETLFARQESNGEFKFSLSNLPVSTSLEEMACYRCERYFVERTFQDAKSELGWDELVARKYRSWMHHAALTSLALWFTSEIKLDWATQYPRDTQLCRELEIIVLPALSIANIREMLKVVLPLPTLTLEDAIQIVIRHFVNRSRSKASRRRKELRRYQFTET